jgi:hypothetical protein
MKQALTIKNNIEESGEWFIGVSIGTDSMFDKHEIKYLTQKCELVILEYLASLPSSQLDVIKAKLSDPNGVLSQFVPHPPKSDEDKVKII